MIEDITPLFLQHRHEDIQSIAKAMEQGDFETIQILGHGMGGAGGAFGFDGITDIGRSIEQAAIARDYEMVRQQANCLSAYLKRVELVFK